ncbi:MAG: hypothetical protein Kow0047_02620 [Anaerolineae bacterium]
MRRPWSQSPWLILLVIGILVLLGAGYVNRQAEYRNTRDELRAWQATVTAEAQRQQELRQQLEQAQTDEFVEDNAREMLGWARPDETTVKVIEPGAEQLGQKEPSSSDQTPRLPWQMWWDLFFGSPESK